MQETPIRLADVPALVKELSGVSRNRPTIYRWADTGIKVNKVPIRLETTMRAGQLFTTRSAVQKFLGYLNRRKA